MEWMEFLLPLLCFMAPTLRTAGITYHHCSLKAIKALKSICLSSCVTGNFVVSAKPREQTLLSTSEKGIIQIRPFCNMYISSQLGGKKGNEERFFCFLYIFVYKKKNFIKIEMYSNTEHTHLTWLIRVSNVSNCLIWIDLIQTLNNSGHGKSIHHISLVCKWNVYGKKARKLQYIARVMDNGPNMK